MRVLSAERRRDWLSHLSPKRWGAAALDLFYPPQCASCDAALDGSGQPFCDACREDLAIFVGPTCKRCGAATAGVELPGDGCGICIGTKLYFDRTIALGEYSGLLRKLVLRAKHDEHVAQGLAEALFAEQRTELEEIAPDLIVAVPMHWRRRWQRRSNSAEVIAAALAVRLGVRARFWRLRRTRSTPPQTSVPGSERFTNVRRAFRARCKAKHVLLVDDVLTTGATCSEAARALRDAGAERVTVAVIGRSWPGK